MSLQHVLALADGDVATAAAYLAKTAAYVRRHGPLVKCADGIMDQLQGGFQGAHDAIKSHLPGGLQGAHADALTNALLVGGIGGIAAPAVGLLQGKKRRHLANLAAAGLLGGGLVGAGGTLLGNARDAIGPVGSDEDVAQVERNKWMPERLWDYAWGDRHKGYSPTGDIAMSVGLPGAAVGLGGAAYKRMGALHDNRRNAVQEFHLGLDELQGMKPENRPSVVSDPAAMQRMEILRDKLNATMAAPRLSSRTNPRKAYGQLTEAEYGPRSHEWFGIPWGRRGAADAGIAEARRLGGKVMAKEPAHGFGKRYATRVK